MIVCLRDALTAERVGRDDIGTYFEILAMDVCNDIWASQGEHVVIAFQQSRHILKTVSPEILFSETIALYLRSHRSIENQDPFFYYVVKSTHRVIIYKL